MRVDRDRPDNSFRFRTCKVDRKQPIFQVRTQYIHSFGQHESALELARRNAAMKIMPALVVNLPATDDELGFLHSHLELIQREPCDRQRYAQTLRIATLRRQAFDV